MSIGSAPSDAGLVILSGIAAIFVIPFCLYVIGQSGRLVAWVFRSQTTYFQVAWWGIWIATLVFGTSLYLDMRAPHVIGTVTEKEASVQLQREGGWENHFRVNLEYPDDGEIGTVRLNLGAPDYDALQKGGTVQLEVVSIFQTISLVRLATISTWTWLETPLRWVALIASVALLLWGIHYVKSRIVWTVIIIVGLIIAAIIPTYLTYHAWQSAEDLASRPLRADATVTAIDQIANIDYFPCDDCSGSHDTSFNVPQKYEVIQMTYTPSGYRDAVLATDSADAGSIVTYVGDTLHIAYAANDPRDPQIIGVTHSHYWRNAVYFVWTWVLTTAALFALRFAFYWGVEKVRQRMAGLTDTLRKVS
jgi:hypothetical protein